MKNWFDFTNKSVNEKDFSYLLSKDGLMQVWSLKVSGFFNIIVKFFVILNLFI